MGSSSVSAVYLRSLNVQYLPTSVIELHIDQSKVFSSDPISHSINPSCRLPTPLSVDKCIEVVVLDSADGSILLRHDIDLSECTYCGVDSSSMHELPLLPVNTIIFGVLGEDPHVLQLYSPTTISNSPRPTLSVSTRLNTWEDAVALVGEQQLDKLLQLQTNLTAAKVRAAAAEARLKAKHDKLLKECECGEKTSEAVSSVGLQEGKNSELIKERLKEVEKNVIALLSCIHFMLRECHQVTQEELASAKKALEMSKVFLSSCRIDLLLQLQAVYPLEERYSEKGFLFSIRGLALPGSETLANSANLMTTDEANVSTALGYLAHVVSLLSKYLSLPVRFIPQYVGSRSAMCDPLVASALVPDEPSQEYGNLVYAFDHHLFGSASGRIPAVESKLALEQSRKPLYWRGLNHTAKKQFSLAFMLLQFDVEQIWHRNVNRQFTRKHVISLLKEVFEQHLQFVQQEGRTSDVP